MAKDLRFHYHHRPKDRLPGGNAARNYGFEVSQGDYIQWFDSDDLMVENKINLNVEIFLKTDVDVVFNSYIEFPKNINFDNFSSYDQGLSLFENLVTKKIKINTPSSIWKREFLKGNSLFDEKILKGQELDFYSRIFYKLEPKFKIIKENTSLIRRHENGILFDFNKMENTKMSTSFLVVRKRIHIMANKNNNSFVIFCVLKFYEEMIITFIKNKNYKLATTETFFLLKNPPVNSKLEYKARVLKLLIFIKLLALTNGKGFFKFNRILYKN